MPVPSVLCKFAYAYSMPQRCDAFLVSAVQTAVYKESVAFLTGDVSYFVNVLSFVIHSRFTIRNNKYHETLDWTVTAPVVSAFVCLTVGVHGCSWFKLGEVSFFNDF